MRTAELQSAIDAAKRFINDEVHGVIKDFIAIGANENDAKALIPMTKLRFELMFALAREMAKDE